MSSVTFCEVRSGRVEQSHGIIFAFPRRGGSIDTDTRRHAIKLYYIEQF